ncbi:MAG: TatD family hydrolase [Erysipelotrichaceae bacterium]|nr:TatD family hydrolase [Erysipelotrichaceae bacterium]
MKIETVLGQIDSDQLGFTLMHEHLMICDWNLRMADPDFLDYEKTLDTIVEVLKNAKANGVDTIVDATVSNMGRDINLIKEASEKSGINIIASAGYYLLEGGLMRYISDDSLLEALMKELCEGISGTSIRAGIVKTATDRAGLTKDNIRLLHACAKAAKLTGVPVITHSRPPGTRYGLFQLDIMEEEGVDLHRVVIGHYRNGDSLSYAREVMDRGAYIAIDQMNFNEHQIGFNAKRIKELIDLGYEDQIILSHDAVINYHYDSDVRHDMKDYINYAPDSLSYLATRGSGKLTEAGIEEGIIKKIFYDNPRKVFEV